MVSKNKNLTEAFDFVGSGLKILHRFEFRLNTVKQQKQLESRLNPSFRMMILGLLVFGVFLQILSFVFGMNLRFLEPFRTGTTIAQGSNLGFIGLVLAFFPRLGLRALRVLLTATMLATYLSFVFIGKGLLERGDTSIYMTFSYVIIYAMGIGLIAVYPSSGWLSNGIFALVIWLLSGWMIGKADDFGFGFSIAGMVFFLAYGIKVMIWVLIVNYVDVAIKQKQKLIESERALVERDLDLARKIQDSIVPQKEFLWNERVVHCWTHKNAMVGGDWVGIHVDRDGALVVVVADAMGKGLQAALVIHAVQSLWAQAIDSDRIFDPGDWLKSINRALFHLGQNATHFVTMGILRLEETRGTYWSAGHVPLFWVSQGSTAQTGTVFISGSPLGVGRNLEVSCRSFQTQGFQTILLGTDGVFSKGSRHSRRDILDLGQKITEQGESLLADLMVDDDKTLVVIENRLRQKPQNQSSQSLGSDNLLKAG